MLKEQILSNHVCTHLGASLCHSLIVAFPVPSMASRVGTLSILATNSDHQSTHLQPGRDEFMPPLRHRKDATKIGVSWSTHSCKNGSYQLSTSSSFMKITGEAPMNREKSWSKNHLGYETWAFASKNVTPSLFCVGASLFLVRQNSHEVNKKMQSVALLVLSSQISKQHSGLCSGKNRRIWMTHSCVLCHIFSTSGLQGQHCPSKDSFLKESNLPSFSICKG